MKDESVFPDILSDKSGKNIRKDKCIRELLRQLDKKTAEAHRLKLENIRLEKKLSKITEKLPDKSDNQAELPFDSVPKYIEMPGGKWTVQLKRVKKYNYYYVYKRIRGKLHYICVGRKFDPEMAKEKITTFIHKRILPKNSDSK